METINLNSVNIGGKDIPFEKLPPLIQENLCTKVSKHILGEGAFNLTLDPSEAQYILKYVSNIETGREERRISEAACQILQKPIKATDDLAYRANVLTKVSNFTRSCLAVGDGQLIRTANATLGNGVLGLSTLLGAHQVINSIESGLLAREVGHKNGQVRAVVYGVSGVLTTLGGIAEFSELIGTHLMAFEAVLNLLGVGHLIYGSMASWGLYRSHRFLKRLDTYLENPHLSRQEQLLGALNSLRMNSEIEIFKLRFRTSARAVNEIRERLEGAIQGVYQGDFREAEALLDLVKTDTKRKIVLYVFSLVASILGGLTVILAHVMSGGTTLLALGIISSAIYLGITLANIIHPLIRDGGRPFKIRERNLSQLKAIEIAPNQKVNVDEVFLKDLGRSQLEINGRKWDSKDRAALVKELYQLAGEDEKLLDDLTSVASQEGLNDLLVSNYQKKYSMLPLLDQKSLKIIIRKKKDLHVEVAAAGEITGNMGDEGEFIRLPKRRRYKAVARYNVNAKTVDYNFTMN